MPRSSNKDLSDELARLYDVAKASPSSEPNPSLAGLSEVSGRYEIMEELNVGGAKLIFRAFDRQANRYVAFATLRPEVSDDLLDPFVHEAWLNARLDHPNIITIHDVGKGPDGRPFFTMDLQRGDSLEGILERLRAQESHPSKTYSPERLLEIFIKVCDAVSYAHSLDILHLDIKPSNIQVSLFGEVLLCDWGLSKTLGVQDPLEVDRLLISPTVISSAISGKYILGTPGYMSPEQVEEKRSIDKRSEVFSLGSLLYTILALKPAFEGSDAERQRMTLTGNFPKLEKDIFDRPVPEGLAKVIDKATRLDPDERYLSVQDLSDDLRLYMSGFAPKAEEASTLKQLGLLVQRNKRFSLTVAIGTLLVVSGTSIAFRALNAERRNAAEGWQEAEANLQLYREGKAELDALSGENIEGLIAVAERYEFQRLYQAAENLLLLGLSQYPDNPKLLVAMAEQEIIRQRFNAALVHLKRIAGDGYHNRLLKLSGEFAALKTNDLVRLELEEILSLLASFRKGGSWSGDPSLAARIVLHDQTRRLDLEERARIIEVFLRALNPLWVKGWFEYDSTANSLKVGGDGLRFLHNKCSLLAGLHLRELDISDSEVEALTYEVASPIEVLKIHRSPMTQNYSLRQFVRLKTLYLDYSQTKEIDLSKLPNRAEVIVVD